MFQILDEAYRILREIRSTTNLSKTFKITDELCDLSTMAMEYFKEHIEPTLPEITFFCGDFFEFGAGAFPSPTKKRMQSGASIIESPGSSIGAGSMVGSTCSSNNFELPWSSAGSGISGFSSGANSDFPVDMEKTDSASNVMLQKKVKKIRQSMKR